MGLLRKETIVFRDEACQVIDLDYGGRPARILFNLSQTAALSGMPLDDNPDLLFDYIQRLYELVATVRPKKLLMIGGGTYTLPTALTLSLPDIHIDIVEIDESMDTLAEAFFNFQPNERVHIFHDEGSAYIAKATKKYDMIIVDAFTDLQIPKTLTSLDIAKKISMLLNTTGIVAINCISALKGHRASAVSSLLNDYDRHFSYVTLHPADTSVSLWIPQNFILIGQKGLSKNHYGMRFEAIDWRNTTNDT